MNALRKWAREIAGNIAANVNMTLFFVFLFILNVYAVKLFWFSRHSTALLVAAIAVLSIVYLLGRYARSIFQKSEADPEAVERDLLGRDLFDDPE